MKEILINSNKCKLLINSKDLPLLFSVKLSSLKEKYILVIHKLVGEKELFDFNSFFNKIIDKEIISNVTVQILISSGDLKEFNFKNCKPVFYNLDAKVAEMIQFKAVLECEIEVENEHDS
jgi:hypothetical protein